MEECCVCYNNYSKTNFRIKCNHNLCGECFSQIKNNVCPICRGKLKVIAPKKPRLNSVKGKINLNRFNKIKNHLIYKYELQYFQNPMKRINIKRRDKFKTLKKVLRVF